MKTWSLITVFSYMVGTWGLNKGANGGHYASVLATERNSNSYLRRLLFSNSSVVMTIITKTTRGANRRAVTAATPEPGRGG